MFGREPRLRPLESRKQLLIAESEINRGQMREEWQALTDEVRSLSDRAKSFGSIASVAALLVADLSAFRRGKSTAPGAKSSWPQTILQGAGLISSLWLAFRSRSR